MFHRSNQHQPSRNRFFVFAPAAERGAIVTSRLPDIRITLLLLVSTLLTFLLPVWAWGSVGDFFAHPARAGVFLVAAAGAFAFCFSGMDFTSVKWEDRRMRIVLLGSLPILAVLIFLPVYADRREMMVFDGDVVRYLGLVIYAAGCVFRIWPMFVLKKRFRAPWTTQQQHYLVTTGFYRYIRHPSYLGVILAMLGWFLVFRCWIILVVVFVLVPLGIPQIRKEEKMLVEEFGEEYAAYQKRTWMLPFVR
jgi:protein-S-isoprenylcysteine O-methyltransferase Ste14